MARLLASSSSTSHNDDPEDHQIDILRLKEDADRNVFRHVPFNLIGKDGQPTPTSYSPIHNWFRSERTLEKANISKNKVPFTCIICCNKMNINVLVTSLEIDKTLLLIIFFKLWSAKRLSASQAICSSIWRATSTE